MANPIKRYAGDDWRFPFRYRDVNEAGIDLTGFVPQGVLTNSKDSTESVINTTGIEDQTTDNGRGRFWIKIPKSLTEHLQYPVPPNQNFNTEVRRVMAKLRVKLIDSDGEEKTYGVLLIDVLRA